MRYYIVDAFTSHPFGGNPAGVVLLDKATPFPDDALMQRVATEFRYSETAFVQQNDAKEFTTRYFTPCGEVGLCGHATIATFGVLFHEGIVQDQDRCLNHTLAGDLSVMVGSRLMMQMATPRHLATIDKADDVARLCNIMSASLPQMPVDIVSTGLPDIMLPVASLAELNALHPDMETLAAFSREWDVVGVHAFTLSSDGDFTAHVRNFAPLYGIDEESATGTSNAALTHYLQMHGIIGKPAECTFIQGEAMQRPSTIATSIDAQGDVSVGGCCYILAQGELLV